MNRVFSLIGLFLIVTAPLAARGGNEKGKGAYPSIVQVTGVVRLVGNEPFTETVISTSTAAWYVSKDESAKLESLQHRIVTVEGEETVREMKFANGSPAPSRRELQNIRIIAVQE